MQLFPAVAGKDEAGFTLPGMGREESDATQHNVELRSATDAEMNMGDVFERLTPFRTQLETFKDDLARSTLPRRKRLRRRLQRNSR